MTDTSAITDPLETVLEGLASQEAAKLARNELGPYNFQDGIKDFELLIEWAKDLRLLPLSVLPKPVLEMFLSQAKDAANRLVEIRNFRPESVENRNPKPVRDQILQASQDSFRNFRQQALPYVGYLLLKKGDEALDRSTSL